MPVDKLPVEDMTFENMVGCSFETNENAQSINIFLQASLSHQQCFIRLLLILIKTRDTQLLLYKVQKCEMLSSIQLNNRQRDRETERQRDRETERQRDRETERQRDRETDVYTYRQKYRLADRYTD